MFNVTQSLFVCSSFVCQQLYSAGVLIQRSYTLMMTHLHLAQENNILTSTFCKACGESRFVVILLWICDVTKRTFIVLMNAPFGTIALGWSLRRLSVASVTTQALFVTRVHLRTTVSKWSGHVHSLLPALQTDLDWHHCHQSGCTDRHHCRN